MIKCHFCKHELKDRSPDYIGPLDLAYECPNGHASVVLDGEEIAGYILYWDADPDANERYKLVGNKGGTHLYYSPYKVKYSRKYDCIFETSAFIPIAIKENIIQMDNLIARLKKMGVFS